MECGSRGVPAAMGASCWVVGMKVYVQVDMQNISQALVTVNLGAKQVTLQLLGLCSWVWAAGFHGRMQAAPDVEASAAHNKSIHSGSLL